MTVLDADARTAVTETLRDVFADDPGHDLSSVLGDLGWTEIVQADPATATTLLFNEQGRALASTRLLDDVVVGAVAPALTGHAVLYRSFTSLGTGVLLAPPGDVERVLVPCPGGLRSVAAASVPARPIGGFDPTSRWHVVTGPIPEGDRVEGEWAPGEAAGRRAVAAEIIGVCRGALDLAVRHTSDRKQYGRPLASFQAVRHQLAEAYAAIEAAGAALTAAWSVAEDNSRAGWAARIAKRQAGQAQGIVLQRTVQVLGAMGLTEESPMHRFVERGATLDLLLGGHAALAEQTGRDLLTGAVAHPVVRIWKDVQ